MESPLAPHENDNPQVMKPEDREVNQFRVKTIFDSSGGLASKYKSFMVGEGSWWSLIKYEVIITLFGWIPGAFGLFLRSMFYPFLFKKVGKKVIFGRDLSIRSSYKISIGDRVFIDDGVMLDAKGTTNQGIRIGNDVFIGQGSILQAKNGDMVLEDEVNISYYSTLSSTTLLRIGPRTFIGPYCLVMSGGEHDYLSEDLGVGDCLPLEIGSDCWIAAKVIVLQNCHIGNHSVIGANSLVNTPIPPDSIAVGTPARVVKNLPPKD
jgi:acetyltransferase-like isoleucine patch superfamily enzyme